MKASLATDSEQSQGHSTLCETLVQNTIKHNQKQQKGVLPENLSQCLLYLAAFDLQSQNQLALAFHQLLES